MKETKGQTLVAIVVLSVLALTVGIIISNRFIKGLRGITESDNSSKALAIAEAGVERILLMPNETLEEYINFNSCGDTCLLEVTAPLGQKITAEVTLSFAGNSNDTFEADIKEGEVYQINLVGYGQGVGIDICWNDVASFYASYIFEQGSQVKSSAYAYNSTSYSGFDNGFSSAFSNHGYSSCFNILAEGIPKKLRLKSFYSDSTFYVVPDATQNLPVQGVLITSTGRAGNAIKTVSVLKSDTTAPEFFDYVLYQRTSSGPLSNRPY